MIDTLLLTSLILLSLFVTGYGIATYTLPPQLQPYRLWLSPWVSFVVIAVAGVALSVGKVPMEAGSSVILIATSFLTLIAFLFQKQRVTIPLWEHMLLGIFVICIIVYNLYPLLTRIGFPTTISFGNLDPLTYSTVSDFLAKHAVFDGQDPVPFKPYRWSTGDLLHAGFRWGTPLILSFFSTLLQAKTYEIYFIALIIIFALLFPLFYIFCILLLGKKYLLLLPLSLLFIGFNTVFLYMLYNVFIAQFLFIGLFLFLCTFILAATSYQHKGFLSMQEVMAGLCLSALTTVYPEGLILVIPGLFGFAIVDFFVKKSASTIIFVLKALGLAFLINPINAGTSIRGNIHALVVASEVAFIGWEKIRYATPVEMAGFYNLHHYKELPSIAYLLLSIPVLFFGLKGLFAAKAKTFLITSTILYILFLLTIRIKTDNYYHYHKILTSTLFIFLAPVVLGIVTTVKQLSIRFKIFPSLLLMLLLVTPIFRSANRTHLQMYFHFRSVDTALISLRDLNNNKHIEKPFFTSDVFLGEYDLWKRLWREHMLVDKQIVSRQNYPTQKELTKDIDLVLSEKSVLSYDETEIIYKNVVWENDYYILGQVHIATSSTKINTASN